MAATATNIATVQSTSCRRPCWQGCADRYRNGKRTFSREAGRPRALRQGVRTERSLHTGDRDLSVIIRRHPRLTYLVPSMRCSSNGSKGNMPLTVMQPDLAARTPGRLAMSDHPRRIQICCVQSGDTQPGPTVSCLIDTLVQCVDSVERFRVNLQLNTMFLQRFARPSMVLSGELGVDAPHWFDTRTRPYRSCRYPDRV